MYKSSLQGLPAESGLQECKKALCLLEIWRILSQVQDLELTVVAQACAFQDVNWSALEELTDLGWKPGDDTESEGKAWNSPKKQKKVFFVSFHSIQATNLLVGVTHNWVGSSVSK